MGKNLPAFPEDVASMELSDLLANLVKELQNLMDLRKWDNSDDRMRDEIIKNFRKMEEQIWNVYLSTGRIYSDSSSMLMAYTENGMFIECGHINVVSTHLLVSHLSTLLYIFGKKRHWYATWSSMPTTMHYTKIVLLPQSDPNISSCGRFM
jgi:hypothetical protein